MTIDRGTFGKVTVERVGRGGLEPVFEFNLQKVNSVRVVIIREGSELIAKFFVSSRATKTKQQFPTVAIVGR